MAVAEPIHTAIEEISARLAGVRREEVRTAFLYGTVQTILSALALAILLVAAEALLHCSTGARTILVSIYGACVLGAFVFFAGRPLAIMLKVRSGETAEQTAGRVGAAFPDIKDRLLNMFQLIRSRDRAQGYYSLDLIDAAHADLAEKIRPLDFTVMVDRTPLRLIAKFLPAALLVCAVLLVLLPDTLGGAAYRLAFFSREFTPPPEYAITVLPGNIDIIKGARVEIRARIDGTIRHPVNILVRPEGQTAFEEQRCDSAPDGSYRLVLENIRLSTRYAVKVGPVESEQFLLRILDRPVVNTLRLHVTPPHYTGLPQRWLDDNIGDLTALPGTYVRFAVEASTPLGKADLVFADSSGSR